MNLKIFIIFAFCLFNLVEVQGDDKIEYYGLCPSCNVKVIKYIRRPMLGEYISIDIVKKPNGDDFYLMEILFCFNRGHTFVFSESHLIEEKKEKKKGLNK